MGNHRLIHVTDRRMETNIDPEEAALDAEIEASINDIRAVHKVAPLSETAPAATPESPEKPETATPEKKEEPSSPAPAAAPAPAKSAEVSPEDTKPGESIVPAKNKFESQESYEKRMELFRLVKARKDAPTPEAKATLSGKIANARRELSSIDRKDSIIQPKNEAAIDPANPEDPALVSDKERLKQIGGATKEDIQEVIRQERFEADQKGTLESFVKRHPELADEDTREIFFDFVEENYAWADKAGTPLMTVLEMARESMFKPSETIQERVLKGAEVAEKVNAMQFPGGTVARPGLSSGQQQSLTELMAIPGMTEEKARELISE